MKTQTLLRFLSNGHFLFPVNFSQIYSLFTKYKKVPTSNIWAVFYDLSIMLWFSLVHVLIWGFGGASGQDDGVEK